MKSHKIPGQRKQLEEPIEITLSEEYGDKNTYYLERRYRECRNPDFPYKDYSYYKKMGKHFYEVINIEKKKEIYKMLKN